MQLPIKKIQRLSLSRMKLVWGFMPTAVGRKFTELQGWMNQYIAATADTVVLSFWYSCNYKDKKIK
jgi:hypothetical protein